MEDYYIFIYGVDAWNQIATAAGLPTVQTLPKCIQGNAVSEFVDHLAGKCYGGYAYYDGSWHFDSVGWIVYNGYWAFGANHMDLADAF